MNTEPIEEIIDKVSIIVDYPEDSDNYLVIDEPLEVSEIDE